MERQFDQQLGKLKTRLIKMCSLVDEQVELALRSIEEENHELAQLVIERDKKVDKYDVKIDKICQKIFALNQPVAMDLRLIMSALTINSNLERVGDIAVNLAEQIIFMQKKPEFIDEILFRDMTITVKDMMRNAIDSFIENDPKLAQKVIQTDDFLDDQNKNNIKLLIDIMEKNPVHIRPGISMITISREMERIGDHATNIAEDVYFIVEAQLIKHKYEKFLFRETEEEDDDDLESSK
jgi:phosphate transport system protein